FTAPARLRAPMQTMARSASFMIIIARRSRRFVNEKPAADNAFMRIISFLVMAMVGVASGGELKVGSAALVITPQIGTPLAGYYETRISDGVHDDLYAKAIVLECGAARAAMVCCDLITMPPNVASEARRLIEKETGLKA